MSQEFSASPSCSSIYTGFDVAAPGANTGVTGGITFGPKASACRVTVALTTSSVLNLTCTDGSTTHKWGLKESGALNAADIYTFTFAVRKTADGLKGGTGLTYDLEVETDGVIEVLMIEEVQGAAI